MNRRHFIKLSTVSAASLLYTNQVFAHEQSFKEFIQSNDLKISVPYSRVPVNINTDTQVVNILNDFNIDNEKTMEKRLPRQIGKSKMMFVYMMYLASLNKYETLWFIPHSTRAFENFLVNDSYVDYDWHKQRTNDRKLFNYPYELINSNSFKINDTTCVIQRHIDRGMKSSDVMFIDEYEFMNHDRRNIVNIYRANTKRWIDLSTINGMII